VLKKTQHTLPVGVYARLWIEKQLRSLVAVDWMVELLTPMPGCGKICSWAIRAYTNGIKHFGSA
jgi:hypothetical protein